MWRFAKTLLTVPAMLVSSNTLAQDIEFQIVDSLYSFSIPAEVRLSLGGGELYSYDGDGFSLTFSRSAEAIEEVKSLHVSIQAADPASDLEQGENYSFISIDCSEKYDGAQNCGVIDYVIAVPCALPACVLNVNLDHAKSADAIALQIRQEIRASFLRGDFIRKVGN